jgi:CRP-like cAMP-binding protein
MEIRELALMSDQSVAQLLRAIPFYTGLMQRDIDQFRCILSISKLVELDPGETIMRSGEKGAWLYFLLKGRLAVFSGSQSNAIVNHIEPGELFGDLALFSDYERCATVKADADAKKVVLFATNFSRFGAVNDFHLINQATKLALYRMIVDGVRWKLELNRMKDAKHPLIGRLLRLPVFRGEKNSLQELHFLDEHARELAEILVEWNSDIGSARDLFVTPTEESRAAAS